jgi:putative oxidoreductase
MFMLHGGQKLIGGPPMWEGVGGAMGNFGIHFAPKVWGLLAACTEFFGGLLLLMGLLFRPACILLLGVMFVAAVMHISAGDPFSKVSHPIEAGIVFFSLILIGPGRYSLDYKLKPPRTS